MLLLLVAESSGWRGWGAGGGGGGGGWQKALGLAGEGRGEPGPSRTAAPPTPSQGLHLQEGFLGKDQEAAL